MKTQSFNRVMHHIGSGSDKDIDMSVPDKVCNDRSHARWSHGTRKPEKCRSFFRSQHLVIYVYSLSQPACSKGTATVFRHKLVYSHCLLYTSPSPRDRQKSRMPSSA